MRKKKPEDAPRSPHRWRENIEALTMAIVVALLFKYFVLEISKIPSGSMQPTLMGSPEAGVFDRTLVDKLVYRLRDPERFEIVVFKHPLERSRVMVKRLVGMPGEHLRIQHGDLWTRGSADEPWRILRRPPDVQAEMWRVLRPDPRGREWSVVRGKGWLVEERAVRARGDGAARFRDGRDPIEDDPLDGYPPALVATLAPHQRSDGTRAVGDVRLAGEVTALAGTTAVAFELTEGQRLYELVLPGPAAPPDATARIRVRDSAAGAERVADGPALRLREGVRHAFAVENLDDRLALELDGELVVAAEIEPSARQEASVTVAVSGAGADLEELTVARDMHYLPPRETAGGWEVHVPPGHYVMLGDNAHDSADSRLWEAVAYAVPGATAPLRGNYRDGGENPTPGRLADETRALRLRDEWGELHWFPSASGKVLERSNAPLVPRELVLGRAIAVFWPIRPHQGLWRLGWLH